MSFDDDTISKVAYAFTHDAITPGVAMAAIQIQEGFDEDAVLVAWEDFNKQVMDRAGVSIPKGTIPTDEEMRVANRFVDEVRRGVGWERVSDSALSNPGAKSWRNESPVGSSRRIQSGMINRIMVLAEDLWDKGVPEGEIPDRVSDQLGVSRELAKKYVHHVLEYDKDRQDGVGVGSSRRIQSGKAYSGRGGSVEDILGQLKREPVSREEAFRLLTEEGGPELEPEEADYELDRALRVDDGVLDSFYGYLDGVGLDGVLGVFSRPGHGDRRSAIDGYARSLMSVFPEIPFAVMVRSIEVLLNGWSDRTSDPMPEGLRNIGSSRRIQSGRGIGIPDDIAGYVEDVGPDDLAHLMKPSNLYGEEHGSRTAEEALPYLVESWKGIWPDVPESVLWKAVDYMIDNWSKWVTNPLPEGLAKYRSGSSRRIQSVHRIPDFGGIVSSAEIMKLKLDDAGAFRLDMGHIQDGHEVYSSLRGTCDVGQLLAIGKKAGFSYTDITSGVDFTDSGIKQELKKFLVSVAKFQPVKEPVVSRKIASWVISGKGLDKELSRWGLNNPGGIFSAVEVLGVDLDGKGSLKVPVKSGGRYYQPNYDDATKKEKATDIIDMLADGVIDAQEASDRLVNQVGFSVADAKYWLDQFGLREGFDYRGRVFPDYTGHGAPWREERNSIVRVGRDGGEVRIPDGGDRMVDDRGLVVPRVLHSGADCLGFKSPRMGAGQRVQSGVMEGDPFSVSEEPGGFFLENDVSGDRWGPFETWG
jgi:hypothetical protein